MEALNKTLQQISPVNTAIISKTQILLDGLTKPPGSLGKLEGLVKKIAAIRNQAKPGILNKAIINMAGDHGVVSEGVSAFPQAVTPQMVMNFVNGGAGINVLSKQANAKLVLVDMGVAADFPDTPQIISKKVAYGTQNIAQGPAMTEEQAVRAIEAGIEVASKLIAEGIRIIGLGEMGIGNTTPSSAMLAAFTGAEISTITGRGTGVDDRTLQVKISAIEKALKINQPDKNNALDVLTKVGGYEIAGLTGVVLAAAANKVPIIIDGFISGVAALTAVKFNPLVKDYLIASHLSAEPGHKEVLNCLGLKPMLLMEMRLGEGTGAALGMLLVDAAIRIINEMATFSQAGISGAEI